MIPARGRTAIGSGVRLRLEGEILIELEGEAPYPIKAGEAFWEPGFEVVHYQAANLRTDIASKFVVFMLCAPDVPMMTVPRRDGDPAARAPAVLHLQGQTCNTVAS